MVPCMVYYSVLVIALVVFAAWGFEVEPWAGSKLGTTDYANEMEAIKLGKIDYEAAVNASLVSSRKELLCVDFIGVKPNSSVTLFRNVKHVGLACDWAVIVYTGTPGEVRAVCRNANVSFGNVVHCLRPKPTFVSEHEHKTIPKSVLYQSLLPVLPLYNRVILMDEDISLVDMNVKEYVKVWDCAFKYRPLVVQPLIAENNQYIPYVNENRWRTPEYQDVLASTTGYVEQQIPCFDAIFFEWYIRRVLSQTKAIALQYAVDWGHDRSWCNAAAMYAREVLGWPLIGYNGTVPIPCALITSEHTHVHHLNHHTMGIIQGRVKMVRQHGFIVVQKYIDLFPTWVGLDLVDAYNPLNETNFKIYRQARTLNAQCEQRMEGSAWAKSIGAGRRTV